jgi:hypothetical protein
MADTFTWHIEQLERKLSDGAVYTAHWTVTANRKIADNKELTAGSYGSIGLGDPDPENFTPYEDLEEGQVVSWVLAALGDEQVETICNGLKSQLDLKQNPIDASGTPW